MQNIILSYPNRIDSATIAGGSWLAVLPAQNLANRELWKVARSTDASLASTKFSVDLGEDRLLRCYALANHNLGSEARWLVKVLAPDGMTNLATGSYWMFNRTYWETQENLSNFFTCAASTDVPGPFDNLPVAKFVNVATGSLMCRKIVSLAAGKCTISLHVYVPPQESITSWSVYADMQDVETSNPYSSTKFGQWVRASVSVTSASTRGFVDINVRLNGDAPTPGTVMYTTDAQIEIGELTSYKPTTTAPSNIALLYSSHWQDVWQMAFDNLVEWGSAAWWTGTAGDEYYRSPYPALLAMPDFTTARYITVEIDDTANPDGYVQVGRLFAGGGIQPATNASYGLQDSWRDLSTMDASESGSAWATERRRLRGVSFVIDHLTLSEAAYIHEMQRLLGTVNEVLYFPYPDDPGESQRYGFTGRLSELSAIEYPYFNSRSSAFKIEEIG